MTSLKFLNIDSISAIISYYNIYYCNSNLIICKYTFKMRQVMTIMVLFFPLYLAGSDNVWDASGSHVSIYVLFLFFFLKIRRPRNRQNRVLYLTLFWDNTLQSVLESNVIQTSWCSQTALNALRVWWYSSNLLMAPFKNLTYWNEKMSA